MPKRRALKRRVQRCWVSVVSFAALVGLLAGSGCRHKEKTPVEQGRGIFLRACAGCHGADGRGGTTRTGFATPPKDLTDPALHARLGHAGIKHTIEVGSGDMPAFGALMAPEDIDALVAYIESIKR